MVDGDEYCTVHPRLSASSRFPLQLASLHDRCSRVNNA